MLVPSVAVGAVGTPENDGELKGAKLLATKDVVAILPDESPTEGVVDVGTPCKAGDDRGARVETVVTNWLALTSQDPNPVSGL